MLSLKELRARRPDPKQVTLRGETVWLNFVTGAESMAMQAAMPRPNTGTGIESRNHPKHRAAEARWTGRFYALVVGVSLQLDAGDGLWSPERDAAWCERYADAILAELSEAEVTKLYIRLDNWMAELATDAALIGASNEEPDASGN